MANCNADVWQPKSILQTSADTKAVAQFFVAEANQTVFIITDFAYVVNTGALNVHKNGLLLVKNKDWVEVSSTSFVLTQPAAAGDEIVAEAFAGITGDVILIITSVSTEDRILASGQTLVSFTYPVVDAFFSVHGTGVNGGKLLEGYDFTKDPILNTITLAESYPANTIIQLSYGLL